MAAWELRVRTESWGLGTSVWGQRHRGNAVPVGCHSRETEGKGKYPTCQGHLPDSTEQGKVRHASWSIKWMTNRYINEMDSWPFLPFELQFGCDGKPSVVVEWQERKKPGPWQFNGGFYVKSLSSVFYEEKKNIYVLLKLYVSVECLTQ